jgi:hypothetical protein
MSPTFAVPPPQTIAAFETFLVGQRDDERWELIDGRIVAMTNPSLGHEEIVGNISAALRAVLPTDRRCRVAVGGVRVQISDEVHGIYAPRPDVMVWCGPMRADQHFVTTPMIIVEVLSPSTMECRPRGEAAFLQDQPADAAPHRAGVSGPDAGGMLQPHRSGLGSGLAHPAVGRPDVRLAAVHHEAVGRL